MAASSNKIEKQLLISIKLLGGSEKNKWDKNIKDAIMGKQSVHDTVDSGAMNGCHAIVAISNKEDIQYMFHLNVFSENKKDKTIPSYIDRSMFTFYLFFTKDSLREYGIADTSEYVKKVETDNGIAFEKSFYIENTGSIVNIEYHKNGNLFFYDDYDAKETAKIDVKCNFIISKEVTKLREVMQILLKNQGVSFFGNKNTAHYDDLMKAVTTRDIGEIAREAFFTPALLRSAKVNRVYELLLELTKFGDNRDKGPNGFDDVLRKLKLEFPELQSDAETPADTQTSVYQAA